MFLTRCRWLTLGGSPRQVPPWASSQITEYVNANSALDVSLWNADFGQPIGTVVWNCMVESQAALADAAMALAGQDGYLDLVEGRRRHVLALLRTSSPASSMARSRSRRRSAPSPSSPRRPWSWIASARRRPVGRHLQHVESVTGNPVSVWSQPVRKMGHGVHLGGPGHGDAWDAARRRPTPTPATPSTAWPSRPGCGSTPAGTSPGTPGWSEAGVGLVRDPAAEACGSRAGCVGWAQLTPVRPWPGRGRTRRSRCRGRSCRPAPGRGGRRASRRRSGVRPGAVLVRVVGLEHDVVRADLVEQFTPTVSLKKALQRPGS